MQVIHVVPSLDRSYGGPAVSVPSLGLKLAAQGYPPSFVSVDRDDAGNSILAQEGASWRRASPKGPAMGFYSAKLHGALDAAAAAPDVGAIHVHSIWGYPIIAAARVARQRGLGLIVSPRSELYPESLAKSAFAKRLFKAVFMRRILKQVTAMHATEERERAAIRSFGYKGPVITVPNGVDTSIGEAPEAKESAKAALGISGQTPVLLFLSRLHPRKNPDLLITAWLEAGLAEKGWALAFAGDAVDDAYLAKLQGLVPQRYASRVHWLGHVDGVRKKQAFNAADVFCLPSKFENFGIAIAEALACGVPTVTTDTTPWESLKTHDAGRIVAVNDVPALAAALADMAALDSSTRSEMGERGRAIVAELSWESAARQMARGMAEAGIGTIADGIEVG